MYIRRLHDDSKVLFLPGTGGRVHSPLEDGIRDPLWSRGLGDVYKRQIQATAKVMQTLTRRGHRAVLARLSPVGPTWSELRAINGAL